MNKSMIIKLILRSSTFIGIMGLLVQGCTSVSSNTIRYYTLDGDSSNKQVLLSESDKSKRLISIRKINVPIVFDTQSIVYRISDYEIVQTENNKWISTLKDQITLSLVELLRNKELYSIEGGCDSSNSKKCGELSISVRDFSGSYKAEGRVAFDWTYAIEEKVCRGSSFSVVKMKEEGYDALVIAMNSAWQNSVLNMLKGLDNCQAK